MEVKLAKLLCLCALWSATTKASPVGMTLSDYLATFNGSTLDAGPSTKVINGEFASKDDKMFLSVGTILVVRQEPGNPTSYRIYAYCGGSILNEYTVLTAGHCTEAFLLEEFRSYKLLFHYATLGSLIEGKVAFLFLEGAITHPAYPADPAADMGILPVRDAPLELDGTTAAPVTLPSLVTEAECRKSCDCYYFYLGGRGQTSDCSDTTIPQCIMKAKIDKIPNFLCFLIYGETAKYRTCAGLPVFGSNSCYGDSGSPVFSPDGKACGSVSAGLAAGCSLGFGMYVDFCYPPNAAFLSAYI